LPCLNVRNYLSSNLCSEVSPLLPGVWINPNNVLDKCRCFPPSEGRFCCLLVQQRGNSYLHVGSSSLPHKNKRDCITVFFAQGRATLTGLSLLSGEGVGKWEQMEWYYFSTASRQFLLFSFLKYTIAGWQLACL